MAEITPELSAYLSAALERELSKELGQPIAVADVSRATPALPWDYEVRDESDGLIALIDLTSARSKVWAKAGAEIDDVCMGLEGELKRLGLRALVALNSHELPTSKEKRRELGAGLAPYVQEAVAELGHGHSAGSIDIRRMAQERGDPRTLELYTSFNEISVSRLPEEMETGVHARSDSRLVRWMPPLSSVVLPRIEDKLTRHGDGAGRIVLLVEVVEDDLNDAGVSDVLGALEERHKRFEGVFLCKLHGPGLRWLIRRVYWVGVPSLDSTTDRR